MAMLVAAIALAFSSGSLAMDGPDVVGIRSAFGWGMVVVAASTILIIVGASIAQLVAWIGALLNTAPLEDKTWFVILLVAGVLGFGPLAMLIYLLTGQDARLAPPVGAGPAMA